DDFRRMVELLDQQSVAATGAPHTNDAELPVVDRIVLYIDDLDRCPPDRVVQVLEAVHLILALPLFVVVVAVDPRWLLQSRKLHCAQLRAATQHEGEDPAWKSPPLHYLEKIIQVPFAVRPLSPDGARALVESLLPLEAGEAAAATANGASGSPATADASGGA